MIDLEQCVRIIHALPEEERLDRAGWLLDKMKEGPIGRKMLSHMHRESMLNFIAWRLSRGAYDTSD